jgi:hypothetical protein
LVKIHVYGYGGGTFYQHLIFMMYVINTNTNPIGEDVFILLKLFYYKCPNNILDMFYACVELKLNVSY